ncbi:hypothetical protein E2320_022388, partial [Naja naja]
SESCHFLQHLWQLCRDSERYFTEDGTDRLVPSRGRLTEPSAGPDDFFWKEADGTIGNLNGIKNKSQNDASWKEDACRQVLGNCRPTHFESGRGGLITPLGLGSVNPNEAQELRAFTRHYGDPKANPDDLKKLGENEWPFNVGWKPKNSFNLDIISKVHQIVTDPDYGNPDQYQYIDQ